jgi:hypothetical protein
MRIRLAALSLVAAAALPGCAWARDWGVFSAVMLASDYRYRASASPAAMR